MVCPIWGVITLEISSVSPDDGSSCLSVDVRWSCIKFSPDPQQVWKPKSQITRLEVAHFLFGSLKLRSENIHADFEK